MKLKQILKEERGDTMLFLILVIPLFVMIAVVILALGSVYYAETHVRDVLERTTSVTVDTMQDNASTRDLVFTIPAESAESIIRQRLLDEGFVEEEDGYRYKDYYSINKMAACADGDVLDIRFQLNVYMPWRISGDYDTLQMDMDVCAHMLFV